MCPDMDDRSGAAREGSYILRGGAEGAARLRILGRATWPTTERLLHRAGIRPGLRVLDVGCGSGEVTVELARLVGPTGHVTALDADPALLDAARERLAAAGVDAELVRGDALAPLPGGDHDLVYARFLLSHVTDPATTVAHMRAAARAGGVVVVEDVDFPGHFAFPPSAAFTRYVELYQAAARRRGADPAIGPRLPSLLQEAGLADVGVDVAQPTFLDGDGKSVAQLTLAGIRESLLAAELATAAELDALIATLDAERRAPGTLHSIARIVQAWGRR